MPDRRRNRPSRAVGLAVACATLLAACSAEAGGPSADPDPHRRGPQGRVAQFVVHCAPSHVAFDDPIVLPWQPGQSHQHQFFGNAAVDSDPGYGRVVGAPTSCDQRLDTASYWAPTLLDEGGRRIESVGLTAYYRPGRGVAPEDVEAYPAGFMMIGGNSAGGEAQPTDIVAWSCGAGSAREPRPIQCGDGSTLRMIVTFPDCWDGERLTGFGSSAHVRYSDDGCPEGYPVALPQLTIGIDYPPVAPEGLTLSSGPVETAHADFWNVWDQDKLEGEVAMCLNRDLVCGVTG